MLTSVMKETEVRERAHQIWLLRGGEPGHEQEDWFRAELELKAAPGPIEVEEDCEPAQADDEDDDPEYPNAPASFAWFWGGPTHLRV